MNDNHRKAIEYIRRLPRLNPTGTLVVALADEVDRLAALCQEHGIDVGLPKDSPMGRVAAALRAKAAKETS